MTPTLTPKAEALASLLPLLHAHLSLFPGAATTPRYGDSEVEPGPPAPAWSVLDCDGQCSGCDYNPQTARGTDRCRGEGWERMEIALDCCYRMGAIRRAYRALEDVYPYLHRAVRLVYVEPVDERSECISEQARIMRRRVADDGVEWMAGMIPGELVGLGEKRRTLDEQITELRLQGFSYRSIQRQLGCSSKTIASVALRCENSQSVQVR